MLGATHRFAAQRAECIDSATGHPDVIITINLLFFLLFFLTAQLAAQVLIRLTFLRLLSVHAISVQHRPRLVKDRVKAQGYVAMFPMAQTLL